MKKIKMNWVDILILLVIILGVVVILNKDKILGGEDVADVVTGKTNLIVTAKAMQVPMEVIEEFKVGDKMMASGKIQQGEIIKVEYEPSIVYEAKGDELVKMENPDRYDVYVTFKAVASTYAGYMEFGNQEVKVGVSYYIKTPDAVLFGHIVKIEDVE